MEYEKLKQMYLQTWEHLVPKMYLENGKTPKELVDGYSASYTVGPNLTGNGTNYILRLYYNGTIVYEISFNDGEKYISTFTENSIRLAHWKHEQPRFYALYDPENAVQGMKYTMIQFPCSTDYFFQRMTVHATLDYDEYELWDTELMVMQAVLKDHPALSVGVMVSDTDIDIEPQKVVQLLQQYLQG